MNKAQNMDELDIQLYAIMPFVKSKDVDVYNANDPDRISEKNSKKVLRKIKREINYIRAHEKYSPGLEMVKHAAVIVLIVMSVAFASVMSVEAARNAIWEAITTWYEERIHFRYAGEEKAYAPDTLLEYKEPTVGDDYERYVGTQNEYKFSVEYENTVSLITYQQSVLKDYDVWLSNHDSKTNIVEINGNRGELTSYVTNGIEYNTIIWNDGVYAYTIESNIGIDEIIRIANTIS